MNKTFADLHTQLSSKAEGFISETHSNLKSESTITEARKLIQELIAFQDSLINRIKKLDYNEAEFHSEQEYYRDIFNNQPAGLYRIRVLSRKKRSGEDWMNSDNPPYTMEFASNRFCEILGVTNEEFAKNPFIIGTLVHDEDKESFVHKNEEANNLFIPFSWEGRLIVKKETIWVRLESLPRRLENDDIHWTGILYDITQWKAAEDDLLKTRLQLDDVLEGANIGTLEWNIQTGQLKFNKIWAKNLGYTTTEIKVAQILMGKNGWKTITHPDDVPYAEEMLRRHFSGELPIHSVEVRMRHKKGHWIWIRQEGKVRSWTPDGKPLLMYGTHTDITTRKKAEQEIYELNEHLEERIAQRTAELTNLNKSLVESENKLLSITVEVEERERNRFSSELHDGMGPLLSTIKLYFQWLADTNDPEKRQLITEKGNHSIEMAIQTARELARGLSSQFVTEMGFAKAVKEFTQRINDTNKIHIHFETNTFERFGGFPELMLYRITTELIKNSLTYSQSENIYLRFNLDRLNNNISFNYSDNGIGFNWEKIKTEHKGLGLMNIINRIQIITAVRKFL
jgi:PAS domain S-box-containing protein